MTTPVNSLERSHRPSTCQRREQGAVLLISLLMVLVLALVGAASMNAVVLDERIVNALHDDELAFQSAEAGLAGCERSVVQFSPRNADMFWKLGDAASDWGTDWWLANSNWTDERVVNYGATHESPTDFTTLERGQGRLAANPQCVQEYVQWVPDCKDPECLAPGKGAEVWILTARGVGASSESRVTVQSTMYARH